MLRLSLTYITIIFSSISFCQTQIGSNILGIPVEGLSSGAGIATSLSADGSIVAIGGSGGSIDLECCGHVGVYTFVDNDWQMLGTQIVPPEDGAFHFGRTLALSDDGLTLIIGDRFFGNSFAGKVFVYRYDGSQWLLKGSVLENSAPGFFYGTSVDISGDGNRIIIGIPGSFEHGQNSGEIEIYDFVNDDWQLSLFNPSPNPFEEFGTSVSMSQDGSVISVGSPQTVASNGGKVRVYKFINGNWVQLGDDITGDEFILFGAKAVLNDNGNRLLVSAPWFDVNGGQFGKLEIYELQDANWQQIGQDIEGNSSLGRIGEAISISGEGSIISLASQTGLSTFYQYINDSWVQFGETIDPSEDDINPAFSSVSLSQDGSIFSLGTPEAEFGLGLTRVFDLSSLLNTFGLDRIKSSVQLMSDYENSRLFLFKDSEMSTSSPFQMFDLNGRTLQKGIWDTEGVDVSSLSKGVYIITTQINNTLHTNKFVKN